jgi:hypothetical protein
MNFRRGEELKFRSSESEQKAYKKIANNVIKNGLIKRRNDIKD